MIKIVLCLFYHTKTVIGFNTTKTPSNFTVTNRFGGDADLYFFFLRVFLADADSPDALGIDTDEPAYSSLMYESAIVI